MDLDGAWQIVAGGGVGGVIVAVGVVAAKLIFGSRKETRADAALANEYWQKCADRADGKAEQAIKRSDELQQQNWSQQAQLNDLKRSVDECQSKHEECEQKHDELNRKLAQVQSQVCAVETKVANGH